MLAVLALATAVTALVVVISDSLGGGGSGPGPARTHSGSKPPSKTRTPATYKVQAGDSLGLISGRTGVPVARIKELNPGIDELNLPIGVKLKLR